MADLAVSLGLGFGFGWLLNKAQLTHYAKIVGVYRLRDLTVMKFMLSALATGALGIQVARALGWGSALPIPATLPAANLIGGLVFGVGMASAGYCPGTIVAEAGEGRLDAGLAGVTGLLAG